VQALLAHFAVSKRSTCMAGYVNVAEISEALNADTLENATGPVGQIITTGDGALVI